MLPQEPPKTSQRSMPRYARSSSMSAISCCVVFECFAHRRRGAGAALIEQDDAKESGSKKRRCSGEQPPPGPPCRNSTGTPPDCPTFPVHRMHVVEREHAAVVRLDRRIEESGCPWKCGGEYATLPQRRERSVVRAPQGSRARMAIMRYLRARREHLNVGGDSVAVPLRR